MGLWCFKVYYALDRTGRLCASIYDEHVLDCSLGSLRLGILGLGEKVQEVDISKQRSQSRIEQCGAWTSIAVERRVTICRKRFRFLIYLDVI